MAVPPALDWLFDRPIAHRGLHDRASGVVENTPAAVERAIAQGYAIEIDVRESADGEAIVFHDATLDRLTETTGPVADMTLAALRRIRLRGTDARIWTLEDCLELVADRRTLVVEIKAAWGSDDAFAAGVAKRIAERDRPVAIKSFNPRALLAARAAAPGLTRGIIGEAFATGDETWKPLGSRRRKIARDLTHLPRTKPQFISWQVDDLDRPSVTAARAAGLPVMAWTIRSRGVQAIAARHADQIVFEGFLPPLTGQNL